MKKPRDPDGYGRHMPKAGWVLAAKSGVLDLLEHELAAPKVEIEHALYANGYTDSIGKLNLDPHIIGEALAELEELGAIAQIEHTTKAGSTQSLYTVADTHLRRTAVAQAARRKAMLYARFLRLAQTAGDAGELVLRTSLANTGDHLTPMTPRYGEVATFGTVKLPGALDSGAWMQRTDSDGLPGTPLAVLIEVKNRRLVLYPQHKEPHQLLYKAALVQVAYPDREILPVLICRSAHHRLFLMAKDLGFLIHQTKAEYVTRPKSMDRRLAEEVRDGLHLDDLEIIDPRRPPRIINFFAETIPNRAGVQIPRWKIAAPIVRDTAKQLRNESTQLTPQLRSDMIRTLRQDVGAECAKHGLEYDGGWSLPDLKPEPEPDYDYDADAEWTADEIADFYADRLDEM